MKRKNDNVRVHDACSAEGNRSPAAAFRVARFVGGFRVGLGGSNRLARVREADLRLDVATPRRELARPPVLWAAALARPIQDIEVAAPHAYVSPFHGQSFSRAQFRISLWPRSAAFAHVASCLLYTSPSPRDS